ncbi:hypothetical protein EVAR_36677_1 [Eumeta japonica]|uniref:Uncharacterized protein n=1 Tax=Eumeta variegata TaxID=151549 RepID=A0A4C1Z8Y2_EUMVA|nr:hypothetical protein EVAR_36677_1 [Eumeta japonica]
MHRYLAPTCKLSGQFARNPDWNPLPFRSKTAFLTTQLRSLKSYVVSASKLKVMERPHTGSGAFSERAFYLWRVPLAALDL